MSKEQPGHVEIVKLGDRFKSRLPFPGDYDNAVAKARQLSGSQTINKGQIQQAIVMLDYDTLEANLAVIKRAREMFKLDSGYKKAEVDYLVAHARSQDEFRALSGVKRINEFGVKERVGKLSIKAIDFLQQNFTAGEVSNICSQSTDVDAVLEAIEKDELTREKVQSFRLLFKPEEQAAALKSFPNLLIRLNLGPVYAKVTPNTREDLVNDLKVNPQRLVVEKKSYDDITPENLAVLFNLDEKERLAMIKNPYFDQWIDDFDSESQGKLQILKDYTFEDYLFVLENCSDFLLFGPSLAELEVKLTRLNETFDWSIPWRRMYPPLKGEISPDNVFIGNLSGPALKEVSNLWGRELAQKMFLSKPEVFDDFDNRKSPLTTRLLRMEEILGPENLLRLVSNKQFLDLVDSISTYEGDIKRDLGRTVYEQMTRAKTQYGEEKFLKLCQDSGGFYFLRFSDVIVKNLPPETLDLMFNAKNNASPFLSIGLAWFGRKGTVPEKLREFAALPLDRQKILIDRYMVTESLDDKALNRWMEKQSDKMLEAVLQYGALPSRHFGEEAMRRSLNRVDKLIKVFGKDGAIALLQKRSTAGVLYELPEATVKKWSKLSKMPAKDKGFYFENGLALEVLKHPDRAETLKVDYGARLSLFFDVDPLLKNQVEGLAARLYILREEGRDVDLMVRKMVRKLTDPRISDTDKIWYLYSRVFGEEWILKGTDPKLENASFRDRVVAMRSRLEDLLTLGFDSAGVYQADMRNRQAASFYDSSRTLPQTVLVHGKKDFYPQDLFLGHRAAEFLGPNQYQWDIVTTNALNFMTLDPGSSLIDAYLLQDDQITVEFGASSKSQTGITHIFLPRDVEALHGRYAARLYPGKNHGEKHKLILCGVPAATELCALVNCEDVKNFERVRNYYVKLPFYTMLIDVKTGENIFTPENYDRMRAEMTRNGSIVNSGDLVSVDAFVSKVVSYYSEHDLAHGLKHVENALAHTPSVCQEIFETEKSWFENNRMSYPEFENLVKISVAAHDLARSTKEDEMHAIGGAQILAEIADYGLSYSKLQVIQTAIKQHNLPKHARWSDDPVTQALYDIDKADTSFERGADSSYIEMILPTIQTKYSRRILETLL